MKSIKERGINATEVYLDRIGYEVEGRYNGYIVARDTDCLVFVSVETSMEMPPIGECKPRERRDFDQAMLSYLADYDEVDLPVRMDKCVLAIMGESRALLRHEKNYAQ